MEARLHVDILPQPDDTTCGPTCLHAIYRYFGDEMPLDRVIAETHAFEQGGGTLAVMLGCHALSRGYRASIHSYNLRIFDPSWFAADAQIDLAAKLRAQRERKPSLRLAEATGGYLEFLALGGRLCWEDLTGKLLRSYFARGVPILTGLSSTWLYQDPRESPPDDHPDDVGGAPAGHFVVLAGYDRSTRSVLVADPYADHPMGEDHLYLVPLERVVCSILLGVLTYDANFLVLEPAESRR